MQNFINSPIQIAINQAKLAFIQEEVPVGAVITVNNKIIVATHNEMRKQNNSLAHAEILAIQQAMNILNTDRLDTCNLYVTLEPCTMCAAAIAHARIKRLYYGASDIKGGAVENGVRFFSQPTCHHKIELYSAIAEKECKDLMLRFFKEKRLK